LPVVGFWGRSSRPHRSALGRRRSPVPEGCISGGSPASLRGPSQGTPRRPTARSATATPAMTRQGSGVGCGGGAVADRRLDPAALHPDGDLGGWMLQEPTQDGVGDGVAEARASSSTTSPGMAAGSCCKLVRTARRSPARQVGEPATETSSYRPLPALRPSWPGGGSCRPR
jgi:hypothetical protein